MTKDENILHETYTGKRKIRIDKFVHELRPERSRSFWQQVIRAGKVLVNGKRVKPNHVLKRGEEVVIHVPPPEPEVPPAQEIKLDIVYEDGSLIVINKPPGLVVHPAAGNKENTLVNALLFHCPEIELSGNAQRPGIVHRLDKDTSGIMMVAKTHRAYANLVEQISSRKVRRRYKALVLGIPYPSENQIDLPIGRHQQHRTKMAVNLINGRPALTRYKVIESYRYMSLLEVALHTGRTHQIRVHLSQIGFPIVGDSQYGIRASRLFGQLPRELPDEVKETIRGISRQMLHAYSLGFTHPETGEDLHFEVELADDFAGVLSILRRFCSQG